MKKKLFAFFMSALMILSFMPVIPASASIVKSGFCGDNLFFTLDSQGTLNITGSGDMYNFSYSSPVPWSNYKKQIKTVELDKGITGIGTDAFSELPFITEVTIPATVKKIGYPCFYMCSSLENIFTESGSNYFYSDNGILYSGDKTTIIKCPENKNISSYTVPEGVKTAKGYVFDSVSSLKSISLPDSLETIGANAFAGTSISEIAIPRKVKELGLGTFSDCSKLKKVTLPEGLEVIDFFCFFNCPALKEINIPESVTYIDTKALGYNGEAKVPGFTVYGKPGSTAQTYAEENGFIFREYVPAHIHSFETIPGKAPTCTEKGSNEYLRCKSCGLYFRRDINFRNTLFADVTFCTGDVYSPSSSFVFNGKGKNPDPGFVYDFSVDRSNVSVKVYAEKLTGLISANIDFLYPENMLELNSIEAGKDAEAVNSYSKQHYGMNYFELSVNPDEAGKIRSGFYFVETLKSQSEWDREGYNVNADKFHLYTINFTARGEIISLSETLPEEEILPAAGHNFGKWIISKPATYFVPGERKRLCTACGKFETGTIPVLTGDKELYSDSCGIKIEYTEGAVKDFCSLKAEEKFSGSAFNVVNSKKGDYANKVYSITLTDSRGNVQPEGVVLAGIPLPADFNSEKTFVYYIDEANGSLVKLDSVIKNGFIRFETDHFSHYAIVDEGGIKMMKGDINGDGTVSSADARIALRASVALEELNKKQFAAADVIKDNKITASDARKILRVSVNLDKF